MEIIGQLKLKGEIQQVSEKFKKREFVVTIDATSQYPQFISIQLNQDKCNLIDNYSIGDEIKVQINLRGREWKSPQGETKYFNTIEAWRIESFSKGSNNSIVEIKSESSPMPTESTFSATPMQEDDLPF